MTTNSMGPGQRVCIALALTLAACLHAAPAATDHPKAGYPEMAPLEQYLMDRDEEIALARSAAPAHISNDATVLVMTKDGYQKAVEGKNGFVCLVERSFTAPFSSPEFWDPKLRGPMCLNPPAARSALPMNIKRTELALERLTKDQILARLRDLMAQKAFPAPEIGSMSYMMSKRQYLNSDGHWRPHLMFYVPGDMDAAVWGANLPGGSAVYGGGEELPGGGRLPWTLFFVPVPAWSDGTPAEPHHG